MNRIEIKNSDDLYVLNEIITDSDEAELVFVIPNDAIFMQSSISIKFLEKQAEILGKKISFENARNEPVVLGKLNEPPAEDLIEKVQVSGNFPFKNSFIIAIVVLALMVALFGFWWYIPSAVVRISLNSEMLVKNVDITASVSETSVNTSDKKIPAILVENVERGSDTIQTSGEKEVGEKAKGKVKIYNKTDDAFAFEAGTKITLISTETNDISFYTTEEVKVEEKRGTLEGVTYGFTEVSVEAENFGSEYNLDGGEKFEILDKNTAEFLAQNEESFTEGSSKLVPAVTESDKAALKDSLEKRLRESAKNGIEAKLVEGQKIAENSISFEIIEETFDKNVEDEASQLNLTMQVKSYALGYYQENLNSLIESVLERAIPDKYTISDAETTFEIGNVIAESPTPLAKDALKLLVKVRSYVVPKVNVEDIRKNVAGVKVSSAREYLEAIPDISSYEIDIWPVFPEPFRTLPHIESKIEVEIENL